ncbi:hypothetical protein [Actinoallomurus sp. CA-150999]|uniref:hypothetical protein n=1 Tax=Actinoallomurus sp. CA-150999 TaxID=3239887 RepID=UPI003D9361B7
MEAGGQLAAFRLLPGGDLFGEPLTHRQGGGSRMVRKAIWSRLGVDAGDPPETLGGLGGDMHSEPLAITQLLLLYHLVTAAR